MISTPHPTEEELILHFYGDADPEDESAVDDHLRACPACQGAWTEVVETLRLADAAQVPEPDRGFEERMWARIQPALGSESTSTSSFSGSGRLLPFRLREPLRIAAGIGAVAALVALAVATGRLSRHAPAPAAPVAVSREAMDPAARERVLLTALDDHFQRSELLLVEVMNAEQSGTGDLGFERQTADDLVASSRLYRAAAQQNGNVRLAQMLEDLELVLVEIARSPDRLDHRDLSSLRARIENDDLVFKVRALTKQIEGRQKSLATE
jgi:hypothetical protein